MKHLCVFLAALGAAAYSLAGFAAEDLPSLAAHFEIRRADSPKHLSRARPEMFYLWRETNRVETRAASGGHGEIWERESDGFIHHQHVFFADRRVLEASAVDLRAAGRTVVWAQIASVVDPARIGRDFAPAGATTALGRPAQRLRSRDGHAHTALLWLARESLPALLRYRESANRYVELRLTGLHPIDAAPWPRIDRAAIAGFPVIDFADLGDMERDPFVQRIEAYGPYASLHAHSAPVADHAHASRSLRHEHAGRR